jgi:hypothetical protein
VLTRQSAALVHGCVAARREIIVCSVLLVIRSSLIVPTRRLVVIGPRLILITRQPLVIMCCLLVLTSQCITIMRATITTLGSPIAMLRRPVAITRGLIASLTNLNGRRFGATRRTRQSCCHLVAGSTRHNLRHRLPPSAEAPGENLDVVLQNRSDCFIGRYHLGHEPSAQSGTDQASVVPLQPVRGASAHTSPCRGSRCALDRLRTAECDADGVSEAAFPCLARDD